MEWHMNTEASQFKKNSQEPGPQKLIHNFNKSQLS